MNAIKLFIDNDIKKVTMDDIAARANVSKMTVYKYFTNKETLYQYVCEAILERCYSDLKEQYDSHISVIQKMIGCTSVLTDLITQGYLSLCNKLGALNDYANNEIEKFNTKTKKIIVDLIREGKVNKLVREDVRDEYVYHYIDMGLNYFQHNLEYRKKMMNESSFRKEYMEFIWSNIFVDYSHFES